MGDVYQATHRMMERTVALKIIKCELVRKREAVDRFHREVKTAAQLTHPNIVTAYDAERAGDVHLLVMEYVDGVDLSRVIKDRGPLPVAEACSYIRQAALGLQYAHQRGMVHRDIKPQNLMVTADGTVKILDFGLASLAPGIISDAEPANFRGDLTAAGTIMGTPDFISPEQAKDARRADIRSDIYSLGATLYFLLSGRPPFAEGSVLDKLKSHASTSPNPLESLRNDVPAGLAAVVARMLAKDPDQRFHTPLAVAEALAPFTDASVDNPSMAKRNHSPIQPQAKPAKSSRSRWHLFLVACAGMLLSLIAATVIIVQFGKTTLKFEINDPRIAVSFAGETINVNMPEDKTFRVTPSTDQRFVVLLDGLEVETDSLTLRRGQKVVLSIDVVSGRPKIDSSHQDIRIIQETLEEPYQGDNAANDYQDIQGIWQITHFETAAAKVTPKEDERLTFTGDRVRLVQDKVAVSSESTETPFLTAASFTLNPSTRPKAIDLTAAGQTVFGIYDLQADTLRLCLAEPGGGRPTAFASSPDAVNDVFIVLKRIPVGGPNEIWIAGKLTAAHARALLPEAASISNEDFQRLSESARTDAIDSQSLSLVLLSLDARDQKREAELDFRYLQDTPKPADLARALSLSQWKGYVSMIQPEYITACECQSDWQTASGMVAFTAPGLYAGTVRFTARRHELKWRIEEFALPAQQIRIILGKDGNWQRNSPTVAVEDQASSHSNPRGGVNTTGHGNAIGSKTVVIKTCAALIRNLEMACDLYRLDIGMYPTNTEGLRALIQVPNDELASKWQGPYLKSLPTDPWGNAFQYAMPSPKVEESKADEPHIWSLGPDGINGTDDDVMK